MKLSEKLERAETLLETAVRERAMAESERDELRGVESRVTNLAVQLTREGQALLSQRSLENEALGREYMEIAKRLHDAIGGK